MGCRWTWEQTDGGHGWVQVSLVVLRHSQHHKVLPGLGPPGLSPPTIHPQGTEARCTACRLLSAKWKITKGIVYINVYIFMCGIYFCKNYRTLLHSADDNVDKNWTCYTHFSYQIECVFPSFHFSLVLLLCLFKRHLLGKTWTRGGFFGSWWSLLMEVIKPVSEWVLCILQTRKKNISTVLYYTIFEAFIHTLLQVPKQ